MTVFAYAWVSTADQAVQNQRGEIERAGYFIHDEFWVADVGVSGSTHAAQRPQFMALLARIRNGETLVVAKLDRLGRDAQDVNATMKMLAVRRIRVIVLQLGALDLASVAGKLRLNMLAAVGEIERELLVERTQAGLARTWAEGRTLGWRPKTTAALRRTMAERYRASASVSALARDFSISRATVLAVVAPKASG